MFFMTESIQTRINALSAKGARWMATQVHDITRTLRMYNENGEVGDVRVLSFCDSISASQWCHAQVVISGWVLDPKQEDFKERVEVIMRGMLFMAENME